MMDKKQQFWDLVEGLFFLISSFLIIEYTNLEERPLLMIILFAISMLILIVRTHNRYIKNIKAYQAHGFLEITEKPNFLIHGFGFPLFVIITLFSLIGLWGGTLELVDAFPAIFPIGILLFKIMYRNKIFVNGEQISYSELGVLFTEVNLDEAMKLELEDNNLLKIYIGSRVRKKVRKRNFLDKDWNDLIACLDTGVVNR